jgi:hypothetical protein
MGLYFPASGSASVFFGYSLMTATMIGIFSCSSSLTHSIKRPCKEEAVSITIGA